MDGVVAAKAVFRREVPGLSGKLIVDSDDESGGVDLIEVRDRVAIPGWRKPTAARGGGKCSPSFGVSENAGGRGE